MDYGYLAAATQGASEMLSGPNAIVLAVGLGAIGLFLMLPRERASWVKMGALVGTIGLAVLLRLWRVPLPLSAGCRFIFISLQPS